MYKFEYIETTSLSEAGKLAREKSALVRAGGVDVQDLLKEHLVEPEAVVSIRKVANLSDVREENGNLVIGARVTLAELARNPLVRERAAAVARSAGEAASPQIRNQATCVGNLLQRPRCWYFRNELLICARKGGPECLAQEGENKYHAIFGNKNCAIVHPSNLAPALMLFDATLRTLKADGTRRELPVAQLFVTPEVDIRREHSLEPGEMAESIAIPGPMLTKELGGASSDYRVVREKQSYDWPLVAAAVRLAMDGKKVSQARVVLGAVCPVPLRRENCEKALVGKTLDAATAREAAAAAFADATPMTQNHYKIAMGTALLARTLLAAGGVA
jgi:xanthine dehydrogenase YagS FAD-binding subunit